MRQWPLHSMFFRRCNLCGFPVVRIHPGCFGLRCIRCLSTPIHRAAGAIVEKLELPESAAVYELSSRGALYNYLKRKFANFTFSEYFDEIEPGQLLGRVQCQDVQRLTFESGRFDLVSSTEVFEHVPNDMHGFAEVFRVLKPNGKFVFTVPLGEWPRTIDRARIDSNGKIEHILEPEYHHDRIRGKAKVLAFRNYGMDILDRLGAVGFRAEVQYVNSASSGIGDQKVVIGRKTAGCS